MENILDDHHYSEDRDLRVKETAEIFTPNAEIQNMLDSINIDWKNIPEDETFLDPTCGSGNFLIALAKRGVLLENIYGVDLMEDNIKTTKKRLRQYYASQGCSEEQIEFHLERNIICEDALTYHYEFWWHKEFADFDDF